MITVLLNPHAGGAAASDVASRLECLFREARADARITVLQPGRDPAEAARDAARSSTAVVAAGGDGTASAVASALAGTRVPLGVLPLGTLNHFARDLHLPLDLAPAVATITEGRRATVDVGRLNDRTFINNASIGVYPNIVELRDRLRRQGRRKWIAALSATATVLRNYRGMSVALTADDARWAGRTPFVFVGNNQYTVDGPALGARRALTEGRVAAYIAPRLHSRQLPLLFARAVTGRAFGPGGFEMFVTPHLDLSLPLAPRVRVALDGEVTTMTTPLRFSSDPGALTVLVPGD